MTVSQDLPNLYLSLPHACGYLSARLATTLFVDPHQRADTALYGRLVRHGFRRSGNLVYRPHCDDCTACVPVRIPVERFSPSRGQRRTWRRNRDIEVRQRPAAFDPAHFDLYLRYQRQRHHGGSMDDPDPEKYTNFLLNEGTATRFDEMRAGDRLLAVAVSDQLPDGLSAVYTYYDPTAAARGLGVYAILWQIEEARRLGLPYVYLGYWIAESPKMAYKTDYHPLEAYRDGAWTTLECGAGAGRGTLRP